MNEKKSQIMTEFVKAGWKLTDLQAEQFVRYFELLVEWNEKMNLTAITDFDEVVIKHFIDSVTGSLVCDFSVVDNVLDLGTGAGFPGIPLKILYPDTEFVLMDSLNKRITFLQEVIDQKKWPEMFYTERNLMFVRPELLRIRVRFWNIVCLL